MNGSKRSVCPNFRTAALLGTLALGAATSLAACGGGSSGQASPNVLLNAAIAAEQAGNVTGAKQMFEEVLKKQPSSYLAHYNLGVMYQQARDSARALQEYGQALAINSGYVPALFNEATIFAQTDPALAITTYRHVIALQPKAPTAYLNLGLLEAAHGEELQGIKDLNTALHQDPALGPSVPKALLAKVGAYANGHPSTTSSQRTTSSPTPSATHS